MVKKVIRYSLVPNRRGVGRNKRGGGLEKSPKHNKWVGWNSQGGWKGCNNSATFSFSFLLKRRLQKLNVLCYVINEMYDMKCI